MEKKLKLGVIGMSDGNGHPYSWSAIFNGYNKKINCPFDVIPKYLSLHDFPKDFLSDLGEVTHIWTQNEDISKSIASFSKINNIVKKPSDMIGEIDALLLARDDADQHYDIAKVFVENRIPVFIDKPLAYSINDAKKILSINSESLIYSCSSMRYAKEFKKKYLGKDYFVVATIMKSWEKYSVHIIEPIVSMFPNRGELLEVKKITNQKGIKIRLIYWKNLIVNIITTDSYKVPMKIEISNQGQYDQLVMEDTFYAFKNSLRNFIDVINGKSDNIPVIETLEIIRIIEDGI